MKNTILVIDDDLVNRVTLDAHLAAVECNLLYAESGAIALDILNRTVVDLVLLDVLMPEMDGFEVCSRIRSTPELAEIPVIMVTALDDRTSRMKGIEVGADDFLNKPIDYEELRARVRSILRLNRYRRILEERKEVDRMKAEFISVVSHELRTPLTRVLGSLGLMRGGVLGELSEELQEMTDIAYHSTDNLIRLVNHILDIDKIGTGNMEFRHEQVDIRHLIENTIETHNPNVGDGIGTEYDGVDVKVVCDVSLQGANLQSDSDRLAQVVDNLLSNAAKFSPPGGTIEVSVTRNNGYVRIAVSDDGPGIPEEFHGQIFKKFSQVDSSDTRENSGAGLGLSICKEIVEALGGVIGFDTKTNVGTTFYFELPEWQGAQAGACSAIN